MTHSPAWTDRQTSSQSEAGGREARPTGTTAHVGYRGIGPNDIILEDRNFLEGRFATSPRHRRGVFTSVKDLNTKIRAFIDDWNDRSQPFVWTKTADEILKNATSNNFKSAGLGRWFRP